MSMIVVEHLRKEFPGATPLKDVNTQIHKGEVISIIGPSGTGKSTFLRCLNRLETPTSGKIFLDGKEITSPKCNLSRLRQKMGMVFQSFHLFSNLNVMENIIAAPVALLKVPRPTAIEEAWALLKRIGLEDKAYSYPDELSGGQKQRAAIARAIAMKPEILLFDEPTSALDPTMVGEVLAVIRGLAREGMTMIIVTHEMRFAQNVSSRIFYMDEGIIYEDGTPDQIFHNPQREKTRRFIKHLRTLSLQVDQLEFDYSQISLPIEDFSRDNLLSFRVSRNLRLIVEELITNTLTPFQVFLPIQIEIEYSDVDETLQVSFCYGGAPYDPMKDQNNLSTILVQKFCNGLKYHYDGRNHLVVSLAAE